MADKCIQEGVAKEGLMNVLTSDEVRPLLVLNEPFRTTSFAIVLLLKGSFLLQNNLLLKKLKANELHLLAPDSMCELLEISNDLEFIILGFKNEFLNDQILSRHRSEIFQLFSAESAHKFLLREDDFNEMLTAMLALRRKANMPVTMPYFKDIVANSFLAVWYEVLILHTRNNAITTLKINRQQELTNRFLTMLTHSFKVEKRVQYYADALFVTARYLSQVIKQVTGKTAGEMIDEMVIIEAKVLLSNQSFNVSQVANELQFSDQSFFGKFFKKKTGISPSVYRTSTTVATNSPF